MNKPPAFQFYAADFLADAKVRMMTYEERGIYITMLSHAWLEGGLPQDPEQLARLLSLAPASWQLASASILKCWEARGGKLYNPRLEKERQKQADYRKTQSQKALERQASLRLAGAEPPSSSLTSSSVTTSPPAADMTAELYRELPSEYIPTLDGILRAARQPGATAAAIRALGPGGIHEAYPWATIGRALFELAGHADPQFTAARLTAFCRRLADPPRRPGSHGQPLTPGDEARALADTLERQERSA